ncbi:MAG: hypothetical protein N3I35_17350 [Clostridia bacterium]|nr:hypothetical protein [Clostridia bacterium]
MNLLGAAGSLYMVVLLILLFMGTGFALWRFISFLMDRGTTKYETAEKAKIAVQAKATDNKAESKEKMGGRIMANNGWIKLAVFSLAGILISFTVLGLISSNGNMNMNGQGTNVHQQHQQGMYGNMNMQNGMNMNSQMGNMQGNMNMNNNDMLQQQINQIQQQLIQIQQQLGMMNGGMGGNMQMQQGNMNNMGGMGMMNGMMGMGNMQQGSGNMSSGGMSMM